MGVQPKPRECDSAERPADNRIWLGVQPKSKECESAGRPADNHNWIGVQSKLRECKSAERPPDDRFVMRPSMVACVPGFNLLTHLTLRVTTELMHTFSILTMSSFF